MSYDDWTQSDRDTGRVWLYDKQSALGQFAFITPIHRVRHWNPAINKRVKCWAKEGECGNCKKGVPKINEFTYGIYVPSSEYMGGGYRKIQYLSTTLSTHTIFQKMFAELIDNNTNPCDIVFEFKRTKVMASTGTPVNGYAIEPTEMEKFVKEKYRPSLSDTEEQSWVWVVPEEIVNTLIDLDNTPMSMIDLYLKMKTDFPKYDDKDLKKYAIKLCEYNVVNIKNARKQWI
tara:strand:+ start:1063 stop:1755 length:693 start_codon:yes stop_codon:yes gene_type:complete